ncbi:MAG: hypothetical protein FJ088_10690, partial [Deltaproteobacteria bacterium]|nr:hypothetical protein [Deltaproteobacteria bacterium]
MPGKILKLPRTSLRAKLIIMNSLMIFFISLVYVLFSLSGEVADIQRRIEMNGTVTAQGIANAVAPYLLSGDDEFLSSVLKKAAADNNLVSAAFIDTRHRVVSHSNPGEEGKTLDEKELAQYIFYGKMAGIGDLLDREAIFRAASPVLRGSSADGYILLQYRSDEGFKTLKKMIFSTFFIAVFWCLIGAFFAVLYVNRITMPLMRLRDAVSGLGRGKFSTIQAASGGEVGELTEKFNEMVLALGEREREKESLLGELKALNESLNERVP